MLARYLVADGLPTPVHQHVVRDKTGRFVARVDLAYPEAGLIVEYESAAHHTGKVALDATACVPQRDTVSLGLTVVTATSADLRDRAHRLSRQIRTLLGAAP